MLKPCVVAAVLGFSAWYSTSAGAAEYVWNGAAYVPDWYGAYNFAGSFWSNNWGQIGLALPLPTPQSTDDARIGSAYIAELSGAAHVHTLELADTAQLVLKAGSELTIDNSLVVAAGAEFKRDSFTANFKPPQVIYNSGTVRLDLSLVGDTRDTILRGDGSYYMGTTIVGINKLTVATGAHLVAFDTMFSARLDNYGLIEFTTGAPSAIHDKNAWNYGEVRVVGTGQFYLRGNLTQSDGATLSQTSGTTVIDRNEVWLSGGKIAGGTGSVYSPGHSWHLGVLENGARISHVAFSEKALYLEASLLNTGSIELDGSAATSTYMQLTGDRAITGTGRLWLDNAQVRGPGYTLTNGVGHRIEATSGEILTSLQNNGLVTSNAALQKLILSGPVVLNDGTISATGNSQMDLGGAGKQMTQTLAGMILSDASAITFKSGTAVSGGTVKATNTGSVTAEDTVTFTGVTLTGDGQFYGVTNLYGGSKIVPGNSIGTLSFTSLNIMGDVTYEMEYNATGEDSIVTGDLSFSGGHLFVQLIPGDGAPLPSELTLFTYRGLSAPPTEADITLVGRAFGRMTIDGNAITLHDITIPEPAGIALSAGVVVLLWQRRRSRAFTTGTDS